ncbi:hypothetical protein LJC74_02940 [Eubacteriales bacterium OttesenSCG-928-A19]|nr:hypothetical protein [Eubacteriales bacterium OttesenSCG-928-A19]
MTNNEMLENIEYLREHANISYEEAERLLNESDGNVMRALVELEREGRVYDQAPADGEASDSQRQRSDPLDDGVQKAKRFFSKAMRTHLVIEKNTGDKRAKVVDVPAPVAVLGAVAAPWLAVTLAGVGFVTGHTAKVEKTQDAADRS